MYLRRSLWLIILTACAPAQQIVLSPYGPSSTPKVAGTKTETGMLLTSENRQMPFALALDGKQIRPISADRLRWMIDGLDVELTIASKRALASSDDSAAALRDYRAAEAAHAPDAERSSPPQPFACGSEKACAIWFDSNGQNQDWTAATTNGTILLLLEARGVKPSDRQRAREYLTRNMQSAKFDATNVRSGPVQDTKDGASIQQTIRLMRALTNIEYLALLNAQLGTQTDKALGGVIALDPVTLLETAKFLTATGGENTVVQIFVFDGALAHAINLQGYDTETHTFEYWDPWGKGSFLANGSNQAGVSAVPHPQKPRIWLVKEAELQRVLYAVLEPATTIFGVFRMSTALAGSPDAAVETFRELSRQAPSVLTANPANKPLDGFSTPLINPAFLRRVEAYLEREHQQDQAQTIARILVAITPQPNAVGSAELPLANYAHMTMQDAQRSDFFTFFHLQPDPAAVQTGNPITIEYRPTSKAFHELVALKITWQNETASSFDLKIDRSFISNSETTPFASDIAKSFLRFVLPDAKEGSVVRLTHDIDTWWKSERKKVPVPGEVQPTQVPAMPSPGYEIYAGQPGTFTEPLGNGQLVLTNLQDGQKFRFEITLGVNK